MIHPRIDELLDNVRLALRAGHRRREACPADQQLPPPARRRHVRRVPAARRVALEELLDHGPRGDRRGQDQVHVQELGLLRHGPAGPPRGDRRHRRLQGVRACRLFVRAGHEVTPVLTAEAEGFVARADLRGARPPRAAARALPAPGRRRPARDRAAVGEHAREARARARRQRAHAARARLPRAGSGRAGDERAHVGAPGDAGERRDAARARGRADRARRRASSPRARAGSAG